MTINCTPYAYNPLMQSLVYFFILDYPKSSMNYLVLSIDCLLITTEKVKWQSEIVHILQSFSKATFLKE